MLGDLDRRMFRRSFVLRSELCKVNIQVKRRRTGEVVGKRKMKSGGRICNLGARGGGGGGEREGEGGEEEKGGERLSSQLTTILHPKYPVKSLFFVSYVT